MARIADAAPAAARTDQKMAGNFVVVALGNFTHPLTRHLIAQLTLDNIHHLLNHHHRYPSPSLASAIQSTQNSSQISHHLTLSKPHSAWIATHHFQLHHPPHSSSSSSLCLHLLKPRAAMNISGPVVQSYHSQLSKASSPTAHHQPKLIIIHDELDLKPLDVRLKQHPQSSKHRGHNGLRSVLASLKPPSYSPQNLYTIAIGIGRDANNPTSKESQHVASWVLSPLTRSEINACSWHPDHHHHQQPASVVLQVWKLILDIMLQTKHTR